MQLQAGSMRVSESVAEEDTPRRPSAMDYLESDITENMHARNT
jgi:hypothetical protein